MTIKVIISSAVISALITLIGSIVTANISRKAAREAAQETANKEIEKMKLTWQREDIVSSDDEFSEMAGMVARFVSFSTGAWGTEALEKIAAIRSKESGQIGSIMDELYKCVMLDMYERSDSLLTQAINERRLLKSHHSETSTSQSK